MQSVRCWESPNNNAHPIPLPLYNKREATTEQINARLQQSGMSLAEAIAVRELYFRVSIVANCNLSCVFCHNEGAPTVGRMDLSNFERAVETAAEIGFRRLQLTGGEPLLRKDIGDFIRIGRSYMPDVGVTTNGTMLNHRLDGMLAAGISRIHVSLQTESLIEAGSKEEWGIPDWLAPTLEAANQGHYALRLNLPVPADCLAMANGFLDLMMGVNADLKVFSVLPEGNTRLEPYPLDALQQMTDQANARREAAGVTTRVLLRGFRPPSGIRCPTCSERHRCKEQSHSLRLGADLILRPCLASREWDALLDTAQRESSISQAALLALDYWWPES